MANEPLMPSQHQAALLSDVSCIVVHHKSPQTLLPTLASLIATGLTKDQLLVVDNSNDEVLVGQVKGLGFAVMQVENRGYAAAVNAALAILRLNKQSRTYTLVATHEVLPEPTAVRKLRASLLSDERIAVAGPTLVCGPGGADIWSTGGYLSPRLKLPRHHLEIGARLSKEVEREWLDGAFTLYRTSDLESFGLDELYFLYFEETDLHTRMRRQGRRIVWVPDAVVAQTSSGTPPRLVGRNLFLFHSKLYSKSRGRAAVLYMAARALVSAMLTSKVEFSSPREILAGWLDGERLATHRPTRKPYPSEVLRQI